MYTVFAGPVTSTTCVYPVGFDRAGGLLRFTCAPRAWANATIGRSTNITESVRRIATPPVGWLAYSASERRSRNRGSRHETGLLGRRSTAFSAEALAPARGGIPASRC